MPHLFTRGLKACLLGGASAAVLCGTAVAQEPPKATEDPAIAQVPRPAPQPAVPGDQIDQESAERAQAEEEAAEVEELVVVGSQIRGARVTDALPVTVLDTEDIENTGATSGDELFRSIPQAGDVAFTESRQTGGINDARGDTASINLRALGTGNTLVLINGRRMVLHPGTQSENLVPVATVNVNAIPVMGVRRLEILRDGAAAIYGTDAVAGVVNTVLKNNFEGFTIQAEYGRSEGTDASEFDLSFEAGRDFNGGNTNVSVFGAFTSREPMFARERRYSRHSDLRPLVVGTPFENDTDFNNTSTDTPWTEILRLNPNFTRSTTATRVGTTQLTTTTNNAFHVQPSSNPGCIGPGQTADTCYDNGTLSTATEDANLRYNDNEFRTLLGEVDRVNLFTFINHDFANGVEGFAEVGMFFSDYNSQREGDTPLATQRIIIPANAYYNPLGSGPGRIAGLGTSVPAGGVPVEIQDYRPIDVGPQKINVDQSVVRYLAGLRGEWRGFDWETAFVYSRAETTDTMNAVSLTAFQAAVSGTTAAAYNPFNGGDPANPSEGDSTPNSQAIIDSFMVDVSRDSSTSLSMADFRVSKPDVFRLWGGDVGMATGVELRHETYAEDRDDRLDGTIMFQALDPTAAPTSDVMGVSPTPDTKGQRNVASAFIELAVPLVSPEMNIPLVRSLDLQLAARHEHYSQFGGVTKPKVAASWYPVEWLQVRAAWSEGFRAPNLPQLFERGILRSNTRTDWIRCEADLRKPPGTPGRITNFDACAESVSVQSNRSGSETLQPEDSENITVGAVFQSTFIPERFGELVLTVDWWRVQQEGIVGIFGDANQLTLDYLLRVQGSSNPNVIRAAVTEEDIEDFAGSGLAPAGQVVQVIDNYVNLSPREVEGVDFGVFYELDDTPLGDFDFKFNAAHLLTFFQQPGPLQAQLLAAQQAGTINSFVNIVGAENLIRQNGRPEWRWTSSITWRNGAWGAGVFSSYVDHVFDTGASLADGTDFRVDDWLTHNVYAQYEIEGRGFLDDTRIRVGVRNVTDEEPPLADTEVGFIGELHSARGRFWYASLRKSF
ncbi:MAG TPA: TonB-dependent receptor [Caulobacteraceae bacterium]|jgi:outer membrane receptor protein involved in Fe transport